jgi:hypothetical protein
VTGGGRAGYTASGTVQPHEPAMNHINLETLPEPVRKFIRGLSAAPEGSVIEDGGQPVVRVTPIPKPSKVFGPDGEWTEAKNRRRCDLIDREIDGTMTPDERAELEGLQRELDRYVDAVAPLPLQPLRKLRQRLIKKAARARANTSA